MPQTADRLASQIYKMINEQKAPYGVGTIALITGLGVRLINLALKSSGENELGDEAKLFFDLCDEDNRMFNNHLQKEEVKLNFIPLIILTAILELISKINLQKTLVREDLKVDYSIGMEYLVNSGFQILKIIQANSYEGTSKAQCEEWEQELRRMLKSI